MIKSNFYGYSDAYILLSGAIAAVGAGVDPSAIAAGRNDKQAVFKN